MERRYFLKALASSAAATQLVSVASAQDLSLARLQEDLEGTTDDAAYWARVREEFSTLEYTYLNCSTIGVTPQCVVNAMIGYLQKLETYPRGYVFGGFPESNYRAVQSRAARFLGARSNEVWITPSTTQGINYVADALQLSSGDEVLMSDQEHPGGYVAWDQKAQVEGTRVVRFPMPTFVEGKDQILDLVRERITPSTRVILVSHIMTVTGLQMPVPEIAEMAHERDILLVVDGAHAPGMLNVNVKDLDADVYASSSHKWMLAPKGSGLLYIRDSVKDRIPATVLEGGNGIYSAYAGTPNAATVTAHGDAMTFHDLIGKDRVETRVRHLQAYLREQMATLPGVRPLVPDIPELSSGVTSYAFSEGDATDIFTTLRSRHIDVKAEPGNALRLSTHVLNSEEEIDLLVENIREIMGVATAVEEGQMPKPRAASLAPNYPNPFNASTQIPFHLPVDGFARVDVFNAAGQVVATPVDGYYMAGHHEVTWQAAGLATGSYFCRLQTGETEQTQKMTLVR